MNFLSLFVLIPVLMLGGLLLASDIKQIRAVCATGASPPAASCRSTDGIVSGEKGTAEIRQKCFSPPAACGMPFHIHYSVGVDGISVAMLLLSSIIVFWHIHFVEDGTLAPGILYVVLSVEYRCLRFFHLHRPLHHVYVL